MKLQHKTSGVIFTVIGYITPQFTRDTYVRMCNEKTGKEERFLKGTYQRYFKPL